MGLQQAGATVMAAIEKHYTVTEIAEAWGLKYDTVKRVFDDEPGVLRISNPRTLVRKKAPYITLRIPASVLDRVYQQRSSVPGPLEVKRGRRGVE